MNQDKAFDFNFIDIVALVWKYKKHLIIIGLVAAVLTATFTAPFFIKPRYKSQVIFYPTTINSIGNAMFTDLNKREADPLAFGEEEEAENALQLLNSSLLQERIVKNFDLMNHYDIDPKGKSPRTDLADKMAKNIKFSRTRHLAVEITVLDEDPVRAAEIANGIGSLYDSVKTEIQHQVALEALQIVEDEYKQKETEVWGFRTQLKELGDKGITNYEEQSRAISEEIYKSNNSAKISMLKEEQAKLAKYAGEFTYLNETLILELESLSQLRKRYEKAKVDVEKTLPQKFILTSGSPAEKKTYPVRSLLVLLVTVATGFLSIVVLLILSQTNALKD
jgi:capsular polysaccharide biosynthesis protein